MKLFCFLCVLLSAVLTASALDREAFSFRRYDLDLTIDSRQQRLGVRGKVRLRNDSNSPQRSLVLQISSTLHWASIQTESNPAEFVTQSYTSDIDHTGALTEAIVTLPKPVAPRETVELSIGYEGVIPQDATRLTRIGVPPETAKHSDWDQIGADFTGLRGVGYVAWYPIATEAASMSNASGVSESVGRWKQREQGAEMDICLPGSALANDSVQGVPGGKMGGDTTGESYSCVKHEFRHLEEVVPSFVVGSYAEMQQDEVTIHYLTDHKSGADNYVLALKQVRPSVSVWLGGHTPEKGARPQVIDLPDHDAAAFQSGHMLLMPLAADETNLLLMAALQSAKLDFPSPRAWISEGLGRYIQARYVEQEKSRETAQAFLQEQRDALIDADRAVQGSDAARHSLINSSDEFYVQAKAANVWWILRDMVGETALTAALRNYKPEEDKDAMYMQRLLEAQPHRDLTWFFDDWVYRDRGLPDFRISSVFSREVIGGGEMVTVTVENLGAAAAEVPVTVQMASGQAAEKLIVPGNSKASVRILAVSTPLKVVVNDGSVPETDTRNNEYVVNH